jgi:hypothetical protein
MRKMISRIGSKDPKALMMLGMVFMVIGQMWPRYLPVTGGLGEDAIDGLRGVFMGVSIGLLLWSVWLNGRQRRGKN